MAIGQAELLRRLDELGIAHTTSEHPAVSTVEEAERHTGHLPAATARTCSSRTREAGCGCWVCLNQRRVDINRLAKVLGCPRLSFGRPELLEEVLGVAPGGVTPFALVNDRDRRVQPLLDRAMLAYQQLNYHPLTNAATTTIAAADLPKFIAACGHEPRILDLDATGIAAR
jgi:Ala-tRNA(Pro) deacylase